MKVRETEREREREETEIEYNSVTEWVSPSHVSQIRSKTHIPESHHEYHHESHESHHEIHHESYESHHECHHESCEWFYELTSLIIHDKHDTWQTPIFSNNIDFEGQKILYTETPSQNAPRQPSQTILRTCAGTYRLNTHNIITTWAVLAGGKFLKFFRFSDRYCQNSFFDGSQKSRLWNSAVSWN